MSKAFRISRLLPLLAVLLLGSTAAQAEVSKPVLPKAKAGTECVEDIPYIRRNHMELLKHQRDDTMHRGIRTEKHSLNNCISCHVQRGPGGEAVDINSEQHFCSACHQYTGVSLDCFQCHATNPPKGE